MAPSQIRALQGPLIVSCQAPPTSPLFGPAAMAMMARAAYAGGAAGIRAEGAADVAAIRAAVPLPILGLVKRRVPGFDVYITPTLEDARSVADAGADAIAIDATTRPRPGGLSMPQLVRRIQDELGLPVVADVDSFPSGLAAVEAGADVIATTLAGTGGETVPAEPDLELVARLCEAIEVPIIAEGRYRTPEQVRAALGHGVLAVVVGEAITDPISLTRRLATAAADLR